MADLKDYQAHPVGFQDHLFIPTGKGPRQFGDVMVEFQRHAFQAVNPSLLAVARHESPPVPRIWDERTKGASKDTDWAVNLLWLLAFCRRPLRIQVGAYDAQQADEVRLIVKQILRIDQPLNRFLAQVIDVQTTRIINTRTESTIEILTTDKMGSHGARPDVVLLNELTHQQDKGFAETLMDNADKMPASLVIIATNAGFDPSWQLGWKRTFAQTPRRWLMLEYAGRPPWITPAALAEAERRNSPGRFRRLFQGEWVGNTEGALDGTDIDACVTQTDPVEGDEPGWVFVGGLDIGLAKHATGFVVVGRHIGYAEEVEKPKRKLSTMARAMIDVGLMDEPDEEVEDFYHEPTHRLRLADIRAWKPKPGRRVSLEAVRASIIMAHRQFNLAGVALDPYQGEHLAELLDRAGVPVIRTPQTTVSLQDQATALVEAFQERTIDLFADDDLLADLRRPQLKDTGLKVRLVSPETRAGDGAGTGHGDLASALSFAVALAKSRESVFTTSAPSTIIVY